MSLSHYEQWRLERIAVELYVEDPWLASTLTRDGWTARRRRQRIAAAAIFVVGMSMLACAVLIPRTVTGGIFVVSVLGYVVMFGAALLWCNGPLRPRSRFRDEHRPAESWRSDEIS